MLVGEATCSFDIDYCEMHLNKQKNKDDDFKNYKISIKSLKLFEYFQVLPIIYLFIPFEIWKKTKKSYFFIAF